MRSRCGRAPRRAHSARQTQSVSTALSTALSIALPPSAYPLPLLPSLGLSLSILIFQNLTPLAEALLTRHLRTRTFISHLSVKWPRVSISHVQLVDQAYAPLLELHHLHLRLGITGFLRGRVYICASRAMIHAHVSTVDFTCSNWSKHLAGIASQQSSQAAQPASQSVQKSRSKVKSEPPRWAMTTSAGEAVVLMVNPRQPPFHLHLQLPPLRLCTEDMASSAHISCLLNGLVGRATRDAGVAVFPRDMRAGARRAARAVAVSAIDNVFARTGRHIAQWRRSVDYAHDFVQDLPEVQGVTKVLFDIRHMLGVMERTFSRTLDAISGGEMHSTSAIEDQGTGTQFRELDEGLE